MSDSFPNCPVSDYPASPHSPQQQAPYPPNPAEPALGGQYPYPASQIPPATFQQYPYPPHGHPYHLPPAPRTGGNVWWMGLIALVPFPPFSALVAAIVMIITGRNCRSDPEPARSNGTAAACWGMNYLLATLIFIGGYYVLPFMGRLEDRIMPWGALILFWVLVSLFHVIACFVCGSRANRGQIVSFRGIPFIR